MKTSSRRRHLPAGEEQGREQLWIESREKIASRKKRSLSPDDFQFKSDFPRSGGGFKRGGEERREEWNGGKMVEWVGQEIINKYQYSVSFPGGASCSGKCRTIINSGENGGRRIWRSDGGCG